MIKYLTRTNKKINRLFFEKEYRLWANRRLPTEAEWEMAASAGITPDGEGIAEHKRLYPYASAPKGG